MSEAESIRTFLIEDLHWAGERSELSDGLPLIENHVVDSMGLLRLVAWLESTFGVTIDDEDVVPGNFGSIAAIDRLLASKRASV